MKTVNARYGHAMGDAILEATARRLTAITGDGDLVARMGGDEFLIAHCGDQQSGIRLAGAIVAAMRQPILAGGIASDVGVSIGGIWSQQKSALEELLADADALLYQVKGEGKDGLRFSAYGKR
ncbi:MULTISPECIES: diguanylate cyclase domain-containing protein [Brucella]|uniref:diguanylate cyclase domain-containing protein n=1 Tax=Brucella TaxID=234 RepID=UPI001F16C6FB|nr:GGDEF domain-containing protein [Brucella pseudogrignonensis]